MFSYIGPVIYIAVRHSVRSFIYNLSWYFYCGVMQIKCNISQKLKVLNNICTCKLQWGLNVYFLSHDFHFLKIILVSQYIFKAPRSSSYNSSQGMYSPVLQHTFSPWYDSSSTNYSHFLCRRHTLNTWVGPLLVSAGVREHGDLETVGELLALPAHKWGLYLVLDKSGIRED